MTDRERHDLRGPVQSARSEHAAFDPQTNDWGPFRQMPVVVFNVDGNREGFVREDGGAVSTFDERGRRTTVDVLVDVGERKSITFRVVAVAARAYAQLRDWRNRLRAMQVLAKKKSLAPSR